MMTDGQVDSTDICEACGCPIPNAIFKERCFFGIATCRQTKCGSCGFQEQFRERGLLRRPYRVPPLRPRPDGSPPDSYLRELEEERARRIKTAEGCES